MVCSSETILSPASASATSLVAQTLLAKRFIESWPLWIAVDTDATTTMHFAREYHGYAMPELVQFAHQARERYDFFSLRHRYTVRGYMGSIRPSPPDSDAATNGIRLNRSKNTLYDSARFAGTTHSICYVARKDLWSCIITGSGGFSPFTG